MKRKKSEMVPKPITDGGVFGNTQEDFPWRPTV